MTSRRDAILGMLLLGSGLLTPSLLAQPLATIKGIVVTSDGIPLKGATVKVATGGATTDASGLFTIKVKPGVYSVEVSQKGFKPETIPVTVKAGEIKDIASILSK